LDMNLFETYMERYADLIIRIGLHLQKGQSLYIQSNLDSAPFTRKVVQKAYEAGAEQVYVDWNDEQVQRIKFELAPDEAFTEYPMWKAKGLEEFMEEGGVYLQIYASNPELLKGIPADRLASSARTAAEANKGFRSYIHKGSNVWAMASVPTPGWAVKVFPDLAPDDAVQALWESIFRVNRIFEADPAAAWEEHVAMLSQRIGILNGKRYEALHYRGPGTNLAVGLPEGHIWRGASNTTPQGLSYLPNLPTEEVFTLPHKDRVNGTVSSTLPLHHSGSLIEGFSLTFENGRIISFTAEKGYEALKSLVELDGGSSYLGEVALVPHCSPISELGIIFYNTLFDENASCHLAIGNAYPFTLEGGVGMSPEELERHGANRSLAHVDFMIGSGELDIDGETAEGVMEPLFRKGNWVD
jgi:aminopeptidase